MTVITNDSLRSILVAAQEAVSAQEQENQHFRNIIADPPSQKEYKDALGDLGYGEIQLHRLQSDLDTATADYAQVRDAEFAEGKRERLLQQDREIAETFDNEFGPVIEKLFVQALNREADGRVIASQAKDLPSSQHVRHNGVWTSIDGYAIRSQLPAVLTELCIHLHGLFSAIGTPASSADAVVAAGIGKDLADRAKLGPRLVREPIAMDPVRRRLVKGPNGLIPVESSN